VHADERLPYRTPATVCRHAGFSPRPQGLLSEYPIWQGSGAAQAGFLFHCYSHPSPAGVFPIVGLPPRLSASPGILTCFGLIDRSHLGPISFGVSDAWH
jgi:hypothetical protein